ncbi:hypothetical protein BLNAU_15838 [Blattamonas nauphoetae]|uniref:Uncharacterized protein n=1 Tax=Blattamonas nauphoetae TaxID=2049346 RepID=A0ABQ9XD20_9EUKA|nr:hypothetical protein BLNAU_15838 [Blattamonas nauphoetae]
METNSSSTQQHSVFSYGQDAHDEMTPLFMTTNLDNIETIQLASPPFLSLVDYIKEGNNLDEKATRQACALLKSISPRLYGQISTVQIPRE